MTSRAARATPAIDPAVVGATNDLLRRRAGLVFHPGRQGPLESAMHRVMRQAGLSDAATLLTLLDEDGAIFDDLVAEVTIGETYFFRESAQFELIRTEIIPRLLAARPARRIRAWSAACASGEEAYSLAIALIELQVECEVLGTDISRPRLRAARAGIYRKWSLRGVAPAVIERWFRQDADQYAVAANARQHATFRYLNLAEDTYPALSTGVWGMDLILCRNVMIYFDAPTIDRVSRALLNSLSDDGWLLLGAADPLLTPAMGAEVIETAAGLAYRRSRAGAAPLPRLVEPPASVVIAPVPSAIHEPAPPLEHPTERFETAVLPVAGTTHAPQQVDPALPEGIAAAYLRRDYQSVVRRVESESSFSPLSTEHRILFVRALANLGRLPEAGRACAAALDANRDVAELHYLHSVLLMESARPADAATAAKRALYLDRGMIVAHLAVATASSRAGDAPGAIRALTAAERLLAALPREAIVPASDGETAGRLLEMTRVQQRLQSA